LKNDVSKNLICRNPKIGGSKIPNGLDRMICDLKSRTCRNLKTCGLTTRSDQNLMSYGLKNSTCRNPTNGGSKIPNGSN
jgi:hypothetical protein